MRDQVPGAGAPEADTAGAVRSSRSSVRTAVDSSPAPETARTSTGVPPSGSSRSGSAVATTATRPPIRTRKPATPDTGGRPSAARGSAASLRHTSAAERSGAPGARSSNRKLRGGAAGPTLPAASSSATRTAYSPGPSAAVTVAAVPPAAAARSGTRDSAQRPPARQARTRAWTSGAACAAGSGIRRVRARSGRHAAPPSSTGAGSGGAVLSTRTSRSAQLQVPPASCTQSRRRCAPSGQVRVSKRSTGDAPAHGTGRVSSHGRASSWTTAPSSSARTRRMPLASVASNAASCAPRSQRPPDVASPPRRPASRGGTGSASRTRTSRTAT